MSELSRWQPTTTPEIMRQRAAMMAKIRQYFLSQSVLEVDTPCLAQSGVTDFHLDSMQCDCLLPGQAVAQTLYLQTSPEYAMKRLLCADFGDIFQITKAFRNDESGRLHNPEFTMLEWYRIGFDHHQLMDDMARLLRDVFGIEHTQKMSYQDCFWKYLGVDPLSASLAQLVACTKGESFEGIAKNETNKDTLLQLLFSFMIEPQLGAQSPLFIYNFPASQAALAKIDANDKRVANRFELYFKGVELANGFFELQDADEQKQRFEQDNSLRQSQGLPQVPIDYRFLAALESGLPTCSGVALGLDRLFMITHDLTHINQTLCFPTHLA